MGPVEHDAYRFAAAAPQEEYVFGSCSPGWHAAGTHDEVVEEWIADMHDHDVDRVVCLLAGSPSDAEANHIQHYRAAFGEDQVTHVPVPDGHLLDVDAFQNEIMPFLVESVEAQERVVVHCLAGLGRTGQVLAAWLVAYHDYRPVEALDSVHEMGRVPSEPVDRGGGSRHDLLQRLSLFE